MLQVNKKRSLEEITLNQPVKRVKQNNCFECNQVIGKNDKQNIKWLNSFNRKSSINNFCSLSCCISHP